MNYLFNLVVIQTHTEKAEEDPAAVLARQQVTEEGGRYVLRLEGFSDMLESSDETAVDSLEPELLEIASHDNSHPDLEQVVEQSPEESPKISESSPKPVESTDDFYLRRPQFRVDPDTDPESESRVLMTPEEADSLLSCK